MKLKELKDIINGIGKPIDRISGFCDNYEHMFDRCTLKVEDPEVYLPKIWFETHDDVSNNYSTVAEVMASLLNLSQDYDNHDIVYTGLDSQVGMAMVVRNVVSVKVFGSQGGTVGLSLQGRESMPYRDEDLFHTSIIIEDQRAKNLNDTFYDFLEQNLLKWDGGEFESLDEELYVEDRFDEVYISFISDEHVVKSVVALLAGCFEGVFFSLTPLISEDCVERLTNDRTGKYYKKYMAVYYPAHVNDVDHYVIAGTECCVAECDSRDEMERFISAHHPDELVGDFVQRVSSHYINNPLELILD